LSDYLGTAQALLKIKDKLKVHLQYRVEHSL
jgi:hypothetical protein